MNKTLKRRLTAGFLSVCLTVSQSLVPVLAYTGETKTGGLCEHHPEHTLECGYVEGTPCGHEHTADCYTDALLCGYVEGEGTTAPGSGVDHKHTQECYELNCSHERGEHDAACGYKEAHPCSFVCEICNGDETPAPPEDNQESCGCDVKCTAGTGNEDCPVCKEDYSGCTAKKEPTTADGTIMEFTRLEQAILNQQVKAGTALADLNLPDELEALVYSEKQASESKVVTVARVEVAGWESTPTYVEEPGTYVFTPELTGAYPVADGVETPEITVTVIPGAAGLGRQITNWQWIDLDENLNGGVLALPGVSKENPVSFDEIVSMLPGQISARVKGESGAEEITLDGWACASFKQDEKGQWPAAGEYTFTASLPAGVALEADARLLEIQVVLGGANTLSANDVMVGSFHLSSGRSLASGTDYSYQDQTLTIKTETAISISGTSSADKIVVAEGVTANLTLDGVNIDVSSVDGACALELKDKATLNLTLAAGSSNTLKSGGGAAGLQVKEETSLTIDGTGELNAIGGDYYGEIGGGAGIGGRGEYRNNGQSAGTIIINGGTVTASGGAGAAGTMANGGGADIGGGGGGNGGYDIGGGGSFSTGSYGVAIITASFIQDTSQQSDWDCIIFKGKAGVVYGKLTIHVDFTIPADATLTVPHYNIVTFNGGITNNGIVTVAGELRPKGGMTNNGTVTVTSTGSLQLDSQGDVINSGTVTVNGYFHANDANWVNQDGGWVYELREDALRDLAKDQYTEYGTTGDILCGDLMVRGETFVGNFAYDAKNQIVTILKDTPVTILNKTSDSSSADKIVVAEGVTANLTLDGVNIDVSGADRACALELKDNATLNLTLAAGSSNTLKSGRGGAGLQVKAETSLTIDGTGELNATGGDRYSSVGGGAGIGGRGEYQNAGQTAGTITIKGGTVIASGGSGAGAGIGGGGGAASYANGGGGSFSTGSGGTAIITASSIQDTSKKAAWSGVIFEGKGGEVYGTPTIPVDFTIPDGATLTVPAGRTVTFAGNVTNNGTVAVAGSLTANGAMTNNGTVNVNENGALTANGAMTNNSNVTVNGALTTQGVMTNSGTVTVAIAGALTANGAMTNNSTVTVNENGVLTANSDVTNSGTVAVAGTLTAVSAKWKNLSIGWVYEMAESAVKGLASDQYTKYGTIADTFCGDLMVRGEEAPNNFTYDAESRTLTITGSTPMTILNKTPGTASADKIVVAEDVTANITLTGVNIDGGETAFKLKKDARVNLTLAAGSSNTLKSGLSCAGLQVPVEATLIIDGTGELNAIGGGYLNQGTYTMAGGGAGIGGQGGYQNAGQAAGTITINGGTVTATGGRGDGDIGVGAGAGIGGAGGGKSSMRGYKGGDGGSVTINGGTVTASGGSGGGVGIGGGGGSDRSYANGAAGSFATGSSGAAIVIASSIQDTSKKTAWSGVIFEGKTGEVYGTSSIPVDFTIPDGATLTIPAGRAVTFEGDVTNNGTVAVAGSLTANGAMTNNGTVNVNENGALTTQGVMTNSGTVTVNGALTTQGVMTNSGTITVAVAGTLTANGGVTNSGTTYVFGSLTTKGKWKNQDNGWVYEMATDAVKGLASDQYTKYGTSVNMFYGDLLVSSQTFVGNFEYDAESRTVTITGSTPVTIRNKISGTASADKIVVAENVTANLTLDGVNIDVSSVDGACALELKDKATLNLTLAAGSSNTLKSGRGGAGLQVKEETSLTIDGTGELNAIGGNSYVKTGGGAGIGGRGGCDSKGQTAGTITIKGGTVTASGGPGGPSDVAGIENSGGAGIGGGGGGRWFYDEGGGGGSFSTGNGGAAIITASSIQDTSKKANWSGVMFEGKGGEVYGTPTIPVDFTIPDGATLTVPAGRAVTFAGNVTNSGTTYAFGSLTVNGNWKNQDNGWVYELAESAVKGLESDQYTKYGTTSDILCGDLMVRGDSFVGNFEYNAESRAVTITGSTPVTVLNKTPGVPSADKIVVAENVTANLTLDGVNIDVGSVDRACALELKDKATLNLTLAAGSSNTLKSGPGGAGLQVKAETSLTVDGTGELNAIGGDGYAFVGGGAGIGGRGEYRNKGQTAGTIIIKGGTVIATGGSDNKLGKYGAGIGGGGGGAYDNGGGGSFSTGSKGAAIITASSIQDQTEKEAWSGIIFEGKTGEIFGAPKIPVDFAIPADTTLTVGSGKTLTIDSGVTLTNWGTIDNRQGGKIAVEGTLNNYGTILGEPPLGGTVNNPSQVTVLIALDGSTEQIANASYGNTITITAMVGAKQTGNTLLRSTPIHEVDFYLGSVAEENRLNTEPVPVVGDTAVQTVKLTGDKWKPQLSAYTIIAVYGGSDSDNLVDGSGSADLTVNKATPIISEAPTAAAISYGQTVSDSALSGGKATAKDGSEISGTFAWVNGSKKPNASDNTRYSVTFTPDDDENYAVAVTTVTLTVNKAPTTISQLPTAADISYGQALSASKLSGGSASVAGTFAWTDSATKPSASANTRYSVTFTPDDDENYAVATAMVTVKVNRATPIISEAPTAAAISYGQALSDSALSGGKATGTDNSEVSGTFAWASGSTQPSVSDSGSTQYDVTFTPEDTANYTAVATAVKVTLTVNKGTPIISEAPTAVAISYGQALSESALSGGKASVTGTFAWTDSATKPSASANTRYSVTFTPDDDENYAVAVTTVTLAVNKGTPIISEAPTAAAISYGQALSDSALSGGKASVTGTFAWTDGSTQPSVSDSGKTQYDVTFTPSDDENYAVATATMTLTVNKVSLEKPTVSESTYTGKQQTAVLSSFDSNTMTVSGNQQTAADTYEITVSLNDNKNYQWADGTSDQLKLSWTIAHGTLTIETPPTATAVYATVVKDIPLVGGSVKFNADTVAGAWAFASDETAVPEVGGGTSYTATFIPSSSGKNYNPLTAKVVPTITKAERDTPAAPEQPGGVTATTHNSITINTVSGQQYICTTSNDTPAINDDEGWVDGTGDAYTFTGLVRNTPYYIWTYTTADNNYNSSAVSTALAITTEEEPVSSVNVLGIDAPVSKGNPDSSAESGAGWIAGEVTWYQGSQLHSGAFGYNTVYTAKVTLTAASGYKFANSVTTQVGGNSATVSDISDNAVTVSYTFPATSVQGQTAAPSFKNGTYAMPGAAAYTAMFTITNMLANGNYKLYGQLTDGSEVDSSVASISVSGSTLTLNFAVAPTQDTTYYISATDTVGDLLESTRTAITVKAYVPVTDVSLDKSTLTLKSGASETLAATVNPENATNKTVTWTSGDPAIATVDTNGRVMAIKTGKTTITAAVDGQIANCQVKVETSNSGGTGGGGSGGSSGGSGGSGNTATSPTANTPPATPEQPNPPTNGSITIPGEPDKNGNIAVTVSDKNITDAISAAKKQAGKNGISVTVQVNITQTADSLTATLSKATLDQLIAAEVKELEISSSLIRVSFNLDALKEIQKSVTGSLTITIAKQNMTALSPEAQKALGGRPAFRFTMQSGDKAITSVGKGSVSVRIPYTLQTGESAKNVQAVCIDGNGAVQWLINSSYHSDVKALLFSGGLFSSFGVGYKAGAPVFIDITDHWAKDDIEFVAARGLLSGTGSNQFSPDTDMSRGMFVTALGRLAGIDPGSYKTSIFTDVLGTAYYAPYIEWAASMGIISGVGDGQFTPDGIVSRQQMAVIMANYSKALGYTVPKTHEAVTFTDDGSIASWTKDAVKAMQMAGVISGKDGNCFDPSAASSRAETSAILRRYLELVIG